MAFISAKERNKDVEKISKSYKFRKFFIAITTMLLIAYIVMIVVSVLAKWELFTKAEGTTPAKFTAAGYAYVICGFLLLAFSIASFILTITIRDPNSTTKVVNKLRSSAIGGKRDSSNSSQNVAERLKAEKKTKK